MKDCLRNSRPERSKSAGTTLEALLRRDRLIVVAGLACVIVFAWTYMLAGTGMGMSVFEMTAMSGHVMQPVAWTPAYAVLMFFMWWIMMIAMMLPSASPMILLFAAVNRRQLEKGSPYPSTGVFALGYIVVWAAFSFVATGLQWGLERTALLSGMMASTSAVFGALLLIAAGLWQLTAFKRACLNHCRSPLHFLSHNWRKGPLGAFRMGLEHGAYCLGCCWFLMGLLFYGGVMNLYWIGGLALLVLIEKTAPLGSWFARVVGLSLIVWGAFMLVDPI